MTSPENGQLFEPIDDPEITHSTELRDHVLEFFTHKGLNSKRDIRTKLMPLKDGPSLTLTHFSGQDKISDKDVIFLDVDETVSWHINKSGKEHTFTIYTTLEIDINTAQLYEYKEESVELDEHNEPVESKVKSDRLPENQELSDQENDMLERIDNDELLILTQAKLDHIISLFKAE